MKKAAIIQARMGSNRLPGKVMRLLAGRPLLWYVIDRVKCAENLDQVVVATSDKSLDDVIEKFCSSIDVFCFRGSENDVLDRYYRAAKEVKAEAVVRITADCPLIDPAIIDRIIEMFLTGRYDYVSNVNPPTYPDGLDTEVFSFDVLEKMWREATLNSEREHVTLYLRNRLDNFRVGNLENSSDFSGLRWTVDEPWDLEFVRSVYSHFENTRFGMDDLIKLLKDKPELKEINIGIHRNEGLEKSLREEDLQQ